MIEEEIIQELKDWYVLEVTPIDFLTIVETMTIDEQSRFAQKKDSVRWNIAKDKCLVNLIKGEAPTVIKDLIPISIREVKELIKLVEWTKPIEL